MVDHTYWLVISQIGGSWYRDILCRKLALQTRWSSLFTPPPPPPPHTPQMPNAKCQTHCEWQMLVPCCMLNCTSCVGAGLQAQRQGLAEQLLEGVHVPRSDGPHQEHRRPHRLPERGQCQCVCVSIHPWLACGLVSAADELRFRVYTLECGLMTVGYVWSFLAATLTSVLLGSKHMCSNIINFMEKAIDMSLHKALKRNKKSPAQPSCAPILGWTRGPKLAPAWVPVRLLTRVRLMLKQLSGLVTRLRGVIVRGSFGRLTEPLPTCLKLRTCVQSKP